MRSLKQLLDQKRRRTGRTHPLRKPKYPEAISSRVLLDIFDRCADFQYRTLLLGGRVNVFVCYLDGLVSGTAVSEDVLRPLSEPEPPAGLSSPRACLEALLRGGVYNYEATEPRDLDELVDLLTRGSCALVFDGLKRAICFETKSELMRAIEQPSSEKSVKGAKDAFTERLRVNTGLVRRRLRDSALKLEQTLVGRKSRTAAAVLYYDGIADPAKVEELRRRLNALDIDGLTASGHLEEYLVDCPRSPFPQLLYTERPDKFAINLLEGRVGLLVDGLPMGFLVPVTLPQLMKVPDDLTQHFLVASALSLLRYFSFLLSAVLPALLVAIAMYHQEMIPTKLLLSMIEAKQQVPFGVTIEVLNMLVAFELLQEAGLRLPNSVGQTVSIIGALIVGQSAVEAKVVSPVAVIVIAVAGICGFTVPNHDLGSALRLCRFLLVLTAVGGGMYGLFLGITLLVYHLSSLESFGVEYLSPLTDRGMFRALLRVLRPPLWRSKYRDMALRTPDRRNQK